MVSCALCHSIESSFAKDETDFYFSTVLLSVLAFTCEGLIVWSLVHELSSRDSSMALLIFSWLALFPVSFLCIGVILSFVDPGSPESRVESELQQFMKTPNVSQS